MAFQLTHRVGDSVDLAWNGAQLFHYQYVSDVPELESRKPYFHPLRTLKGHAVTTYRPWDHRWHVGLCMTLTDVSGHNFWGGGTFVRDKGYVQLPNVGHQIHAAWHEISAAGDNVAMRQSIDWITADGEKVIGEERQIDVASIRPDAGYWTLAVRMRLVNVCGRPLEIGSPTTNGRPNAGYGGLYWRGPRDFAGGGKVLAADGIAGQDDAMGVSSPWLAYVGRHDEVDAVSTLIFIDSSGNPRYPTKWFVRSTPFACASFSFMFDEIYTLGPGETLALSYRVVIADGGRERDEIERIAAKEQEK